MKKKTTLFGIAFISGLLSACGGGGGSSDSPSSVTTPPNVPNDSILMCAEKTGGFNLVNYRHSSGVYHEQETEDLHRRI